MEFELSAFYHSLIKSCDRPSVNSLKIGQHGPEMGRQWMVVGPTGKFRLSDEFPKLVFVRPRLVDGGLLLETKDNSIKPVTVPISDKGDQLEVEMFEHLKLPAVDDGIEAGRFFNEVLDVEGCQLVHLADDYVRTDGRGLARFNLADSWSMTGSGDKALENLGRRIEKNGRKPVPRERFGHDFWFSGGEAYDEDGWEEIAVVDKKTGEIKLSINVIKPIQRCGRTGIRREANSVEELLKKDIEPNATLSEYRRLSGKPGVYFGQKMAPAWEGQEVELHLGDRIEITKTKPHPNWQVKDK